MCPYLAAAGSSLRRRLGATTAQPADHTKSEMKSNIVCALGFIFILGIVSSRADFEALDDEEENIRFSFILRSFGHLISRIILCLHRSGSDHNTAVVPLEHALSVSFILEFFWWFVLIFLFDRRQEILVCEGN